MSYILIIGDDETTREYLSRLLTEEGYEIRTATHGAAALAHVGAQQPALILVNERMLARDGSEFLRLYLDTPQPHAPIMIIRVPVPSTEAGGRLGRPTELLQAIELIYQYLRKTNE